MKPERTHLHLNLTLTVNRRWGWLAGAIGGLDLVLQAASLLMRAAGHP